ncbi:MAG: acetyl-CoA C-acyltransferase [Gammaproteobacteria bacterium]|nr:acetyl-CoA C-acyltransferase [Gammaproteobacteria bacterium]MCP4089748.1 acetyl-CoA C-acyltransferase [Gammaproteobacteria bacterium]MCP4278235.1 acetyl-CoA C-acyltransferase [Gammaproteobacteria bacterium]MCP4831954.1 acetyl-CoA C-acyltransferase [Gammaproteobacteria bacterium]MCP4927574.1 acetyl-CoA C-acyltransferase [Gammaproteobacteria bacterium]
MSKESIVIVAARRTPIGSFQGNLSGASSPQLSAAATQACLTDTGIKGKDIDEAVIGCVLPAGLGQAPARQAVLASNLPESVDTTTINKVCGSGMKAAMLAHDLILAGSANIVLAGGMESMTNAPYLLPKARAGYRMGHQDVLDHMFFDGLQNPYDGNMMGYFAEETAKKYGFTREDQDNFTTESVTRAVNAIENGSFDAEITPVTVTYRRKESIVDTDEEPTKCDLAGISTMRPAFAKDGSVTAASSSSISDGAASLILMKASDAEKRGLMPLARIVAHAGHAHEPEWFTTAPVGAIKSVLSKAGWSADDVDLFEINEAFACVTMAAMHDINIDAAKVNVNGGACALGHPIGASGARILVTLIHALRSRNLTKGVASLCIGGGEAVAMAVEI